ncbi:hypothetical protein EDC04DRAFT_2616221 [Pisolithus marmoratus]|nr:hypothetical protein EDC04DRAFT_2616221 [Pisolithus marmoratus]
MSPTGLFGMMQRPAMAISSKQPQVLECMVSSSAQVPSHCRRVLVLTLTSMFLFRNLCPSGWLSTGYELPSIMDAENGALSTAFPSLSRALMSASRYQDAAIYHSQYAQANYPNVSTSTLAKIGGLPQSRVNPFSFPIIPSFQSLKLTFPFEVIGLIQHSSVAQDHASDHTAYPRTVLSSPHTCTLLPHAVECPLGYPQDDENVSRFGPGKQHIAVSSDDKPKLRVMHGMSSQMASIKSM